MFIAYTDASVKVTKTVLAFHIIFEDRSTISRRIVIDERDNNIAEGLAFVELISFLKHYHMNKGIILIDSKVLKTQMNNRKSKMYKYIPKDIKETIKGLKIRVQLIPRSCNVAHHICYRNKFKKSTAVSSINRTIYSNIPDYPDYFLDVSVLVECRRLFNKPSITFHDTQIKLNKLIWLSDLLEESDNKCIFLARDKKIKIFNNTIVGVYPLNYVQLGNHWRMVSRKKRLRKLLKNIT